MTPNTPLFYRAFPVFTAPTRTTIRWTPGHITWGGLRGWVEQPADHKECGGYVLGELQDGKRRRGTVISRNCLTLDADADAGQDFPFVAGLYLGCDHIIHTTFSSTPEVPRYRVIAPFSRPVSAEESYEVHRRIMERIGIERFDPGSAEPNRFMWKPSRNPERPEAYWYSITESLGPLDVDAILADWDRSYNTAPTPGKPGAQKQNPLELPGLIGTFNRTWTPASAIREFELPYDQVADGRWHYRGGAGEAGLTTLDDPNLVYSHHSTDPCFHQTCTAFDLVRLHRFGEMDLDVPPGTSINDLPSMKEMLKFAAGIPQIAQAEVEESYAGIERLGPAAVEENQDWRTGLTRHRLTRAMLDTVDNWDLLRKHHPLLRNLAFNELSTNVETRGLLPWRSVGVRPDDRAITKTDRDEIRFQIEREFKMRPSVELMDSVIGMCASDRSFNPIVEYLNGLTWDGTPRVETALPGVRPTPYTRMVAKKCLVAAVARMMDPGCKWDHCLVLHGKEGLGKSFWVDRMARGLSDTLGKITEKDTLLAMQRSWIMLADEGVSMRKSDADQLKEFITRRHDIFRMPYDRETTAHPRHCVIWATTNDDVFLRAQEGNRRFLIVDVVDKVDFEAMTDAYVDQVWAEAVALYKAGEPLFLSDEESSSAAEERAQYVEEDALLGQLEAYLETKVADNWRSREREDRLSWIRQRGLGFVPEGTERIDTCSSVQLWYEALGNTHGTPNRVQLLEISRALKQLGWVADRKNSRDKAYGTQKLFRRQPTNLH